MRPERLIGLLLLLAATASCQQARVTHVVICWLKTPGDEAARRQLIADSKFDCTATVRMSCGMSQAAIDPTSTAMSAPGMSFNRCGLRAFHPTNAAIASNPTAAAERWCG